MSSRRRFIGQVASGLAGTLADPARVLGSSDRVRIGVIGAGERGAQLAREALACGRTELAGFADVYARRLEAVQAFAPSSRLYCDYRGLLEDKSIDAILIATPQHLHCEHFVAALAAGKHVYIEKTMAFTVAEATRMREASQGARGRVVQVGHQACSSGLMTDALRFLSSRLMGKVTAIHAHMYRNTPHGKPQWVRPLYPDMTPDTISWSSFLGSAPHRAFDATRYANWRLFWDYSGGNVFENLSQQLAFWYRALDLQIPASASMSGGIHLWKDGREVPDTMSVALEHSEEILFSWDSGFGNNQPGISEEVLGTDGSIWRGQQIRYLPQKINQPTAVEALGQSRSQPNGHMHNFLECIRTGGEPNCPLEIGYRVSVACRMAVESYRQGRTVHWDPVKEEIV